MKTNDCDEVASDEDRYNEDPYSGGQGNISEVLFIMKVEVKFGDCQI